jgi:hypothetical protein
MRMEGVVRKMQEIFVSNHSTTREKMLLDPYKKTLRSFCKNMDIGLEKTLTSSY